MSQPAKAQEPSMEEILASIRRIIADDEKPAEKIAPPPVATQAEPARPAPPPMPAAMPATEPAAEMDTMLAEIDDGQAAPIPVPSPDNDVLELTEDMTRPASAPAFRTVDAHDDIEFSATYPAEAAHEPPQVAAVQTRPLISATTMAAVDSAFNSLANTVLAGNARTLEDLVREMLRPMLKSWLDDNLPGLVERIVKAEIERVSRGR